MPNHGDEVKVLCQLEAANSSSSKLKLNSSENSSEGSVRKTMNEAWDC